MRESQGRLFSLLCQAVGRTPYDLWLRPATIWVEQGLWLYIHSPNRVVYTKLLTLFPTLEEVVQKNGLAKGVRILPPLEKQYLKELKQLVLGRENLYIEHLLLQLISQPVIPWSLWLYGERGVGKTHFLKILQLYREKLFPEQKIYLSQGKEFFSKIKNLKQDQVHSLFLLDHLEEIPKGEEEDFARLLLWWQQTGRVCIITSCHPPHHLCSSRRLLSLFQQGIVAKIDSPSERTKELLLLTRYPEARQYPQEVVREFCRRFQNPRELLKAWQAFSQQGLEKDLPQESSLALQKRFFSFFLEKMNLTKEEFFSLKRRHRIVQARRLFAHLLRQLFQATPREIHSLLPNTSLITIRRYLREPLPASLEAQAKELISLWHRHPPKGSTFPLESSPHAEGSQREC